MFKAKYNKLATFCKYVLYLFKAKIKLWNSNNSNNESLKFNQWLAGLIDGGGYLLLSKNGYVSFKITINTSDKNVLYVIKNKYGGSIKSVSKDKAFRYKLQHKKGIVDLINGVNGLIRNPARILELKNLCIKYGIYFIQPLPLTFNNGWLSGF